MICFRDRTFCEAPCLNAICDRNFYLPEQKSQIQEAANRWWGEPGAPICVGDLSAGCSDFVRDTDQQCVDIPSETV